MLVKNQKQVNMVKDAIAQMKGSVIVVDTRNNREFDLHQPVQYKLAMDSLSRDYQDRMEFYVSRREDMEIMIGLIHQLRSSSAQYEVLK